MATSGSTNFATSRDSLIKYAYYNIGKIGEGETPSATQVTDAAIILNMIVKFWHTKGLPLWALKTGYLLPIAATNSMLATSHVVTTYTQTTLDADEASGQTALTVASITGISASDVLGVELDDGTIHWTTVNGAPSGTTVTATAPLPSAAADGNIVYAYTTSNRISRPLRVIHAYTRDVTSTTDTEIEIVGYQDIAQLSAKTSEGRPNRLFYDPQLVGEFTWWPRFENGDHVIVFRYHRPFEDFDASGDEPDFPQEWYLPLLWYLSWAMSGSSGVPLDIRNQWLKEATMLLNEVENLQQEEGSVRIEPRQGFK